MSDIFQEVEEDLRAERARKLLQKYGGVLVAAAVVVIVATGGWEFWKAHQAKLNARVAETFLTALDGAAGPPGEGRKSAEVELADVQKTGNAAYRTLASLRDAALKADTGDKATALALWREVANNGNADRLLRDAAALLAVQHDLDSGDPAALATQLKPLAAPDNPWHALAQEAQALLDLRQGHTDDARAKLKQLAQDVTAPEGVRGQANGLLARLGG